MTTARHAVFAAGALQLVVRDRPDASDFVDSCAPLRPADRARLSGEHGADGVEEFLEIDRLADVGFEAGLVPEDVEERVGREVAVARAQVGPVAPVEVGPQHLAVRHHHALRRARGARREEDVDRKSVV